MPEPPPRRRLTNRLRACLLHALAAVGKLDGEPIRVSESDGEHRATIVVEQLAGEAAAPPTQAPLPSPLPYSSDELADMLACGPRGAFLVKEIARRRQPALRPDDPRLKVRLRNLRERKALGHCAAGYYWVNTNPELLDDEDDPREPE